MLQWPEHASNAESRKSMSRLGRPPSLARLAAQLRRTAFAARSPWLASRSGERSERFAKAGAEGGIRTPTLLRAPAPQAGASASSATSATRGLKNARARQARTFEYTVPGRADPRDGLADRTLLLRRVLREQLLRVFRQFLHELRSRALVVPIHTAPDGHRVAGSNEIDHERR